MFEIARNVLFCQHKVSSSVDQLDSTQESTHKVRLITWQLVNLVFCRKLPRQGSHCENCDVTLEMKETKSEEVDEANRHTPPQLNFCKEYEGNRLKSKVSIKFRNKNDKVTSSNNESESPSEIPEFKERKFVVKEAQRVRSRSLMNYKRKFSTKRSNDPRNQSVRNRRRGDDKQHDASCPDLVSADDKNFQEEGHEDKSRTCRSFDSLDNFTSQLFKDDFINTTHEDLLSICFE